MIAYFVFLIPVLAAWIFQKGAYVHPESVFFLQNYLEPGRSLLQKLFDPNRNDWGFYQARELSYFFDWIDAHFVQWTIRLRMPVFYQLSHFVAIWGIAAFHYRQCMKYLSPKHAPIYGLMGLLFLTAPVSALSGMYFRSSKSLLAWTLMIIFWQVFVVLKGQARSTRLSFGLILALIATLLDRQGVFAVFGLFLICATHGVIYRKKLSFHWAGVFAGAVLLNTIYNLFLGPYLIHAINGYWPSFEFQKIDSMLVFSKYHYYYYAVNLLCDHIRWMFGSMHKQVAIIFSLGVISLLGSRTWAVVVTVASFFLVNTLYALMLVRHDALVWLDTRRIYYWVPVTALLLFGATHAMDGLLVRKPTWSRWIVGILAVMVTLNFIQWPNHQQFVDRGFLKREIASQPELKHCLLDFSRDPASYLQISKQTRALCAFFRGLPRDSFVERMPIY